MLHYNIYKSFIWRHIISLGFRGLTTMKMFTKTCIIHFVFADWDHGHGCLSLDARLYNQVKSAYVRVTTIIFIAWIFNELVLRFQSLFSSVNVDVDIQISSTHVWIIMIIFSLTFQLFRSLFHLPYYRCHCLRLGKEVLSNFTFAQKVVDVTKMKPHILI